MKEATLVLFGITFGIFFCAFTHDSFCVAEKEVARIGEIAMDMNEAEKKFDDEENEELLDLWDGPPNAKGFYLLGWKQAMEHFAESKESE